MLVVEHIVENAVQTFLGTHKAFNAEGYYVDSSHTTASGRQLAAWRGTELGSRRERALIAYDANVTYIALVGRRLKHRRDRAMGHLGPNALAAASPAPRSTAAGAVANPITNGAIAPNSKPSSKPMGVGCRKNRLELGRNR